MSELGIIQKTAQPNTIASLSADLRALVVAEGMTLLAHSSMSSIGWVCGGEAAVVAALETALGETGTLVMPTHSGDLSDPANWEHPPVPAACHETIRKEMPYRTRSTSTLSG